METIERKIERFNKKCLADLLLQRMSEGWTVLYTISLPISPPQYNIPSYPLSSTNAYAVDTNTGAIVFQYQSQPVPYLPEPMIEVCFIKRNWEKDPCPRCSYPYPDPERIDREA